MFLEFKTDLNFSTGKECVKFSSYTRSNVVLVGVEVTNSTQ
jgi:hypothetical protein